MKIKFTQIRRSIVAFLMIGLGSYASACNYSNLTLNSVVDLNNGNYEIEMTFCTGGGQNATSTGADQNTATFAFLLSGGATYNSYPQTLTSPQTGADYSALLYAPDTLLYLNQTEWWACLGGCGPVEAVCTDLTINTNGLPQSIFCLGMEGGGNPLASCLDADMYVYPDPNYDPCNNFTVAADAGADRTVYQGYTPAECTTLSVSTTGNYTGALAYEWSTGETASSIIVCPTEETNYHVHVTDDNNCETSDEVLVMVENIACGKRGNKVEVCKSNGRSSCVSFSKVDGILSNGGSLGFCNNAMDLFGETVVIEEQLAVFPTVFSSYSNLNYTTNEDGNLSIKMYNLVGNKVMDLYSGEHASGDQINMEINGDTLIPGIYIVNLRTETGTIKNVRIIKN